jgi:hypothetical protein
MPMTNQMMTTTLVVVAVGVTSCMKSASVLTYEHTACVNPRPLDGTEMGRNHLHHCVHYVYPRLKERKLVMPLNKIAVKFKLEKNFIFNTLFLFKL